MTAWRGDLADLVGPPWARTDRLGRPFAKDPSVVRFQDRYLLYYSLPPVSGDIVGWVSGWDVGIAESADLTDWHPVGIVGRLGPHDPHGRAAPGAIVLDGQVHLFLQSFGNGVHDAIHHAVSSDGVHFAAPHDGEPVFAPRGRWSCGRAIDADVTVFGDHLVMAYATRDVSLTRQIVGFARADLDSDFGPGSWTDLHHDAPALAPELPWERDCIEAAALGVRDGSLVTFYAGGYNNDPQQIGVATSADGVEWTRQSDEPFVANGPPGSWNSSESGHPGLLTVDEMPTHLFFQGNDDGGRTWYLAGVALDWNGMRPSVAGHAY